MYSADLFHCEIDDRHLNHTAVVEFLQPAPAERPSSTSSPKKRIRSDVPIAESAQKVGVAHRLKAIPPSLHQSIQLGSEEERQPQEKRYTEAAPADSKPAEIVARAEQAQLKQAKLVFPHSTSL